MKKNWTKVALALGPAIMIASIAWEYASTSRDYTYLVQPWSIRGYETIHGWIIVTIGMALLVGGLLTSMERSTKPRNSALVVGYFVVAATAFTAIFATDDVTMSLSGMRIVLVSVTLGIAISLALRGRLGESNRLFKRALLTFVPISGALFLAFNAVLAEAEISLPAWSLVLIVFLILGALTTAIKPTDMAANRMLIIASVASSMVVLLSAGAIRQSLVDIQIETDQGGGVSGIAAQYKDTQAALGWWLAGFGAFIVFVGAVGLWARRRDIIAAVARAKKQRLAAETSAKEIADAAEAYAREHEEASAR